MRRVRDWDLYSVRNLSKKINNENIMLLSPKIIKVLISKLRDEIGLDGIII